MTNFDAYYHWMAIPPGKRPPDHYQLLGLQQFEQNIEVIQHAADARMRHIASFAVGPHAECSQRLLTEISAARICLSSPEKRAAYDQSLRTKLASVPPRRTTTEPANPIAAQAVPLPSPVSTAAAPQFSVVAESRAVKKSSLISKFLPLVILGVALLTLAFVVQKLKSSAKEQQLASETKTVTADTSSLEETSADELPVDLAHEVAPAAQDVNPSGASTGGAGPVAIESAPSAVQGDNGGEQRQPQPTVPTDSQNAESGKTSVDSNLFSSPFSNPPLKVEDDANTGNRANVTPQPRAPFHSLADDGDASGARPVSPPGDRMASLPQDDALEVPQVEEYVFDLDAPRAKLTTRQRKVLHQALDAMLAGDIVSYQRAVRSMDAAFAEPGSEGHARAELLKDMDEAATIYWGELRTTLESMRAGAEIVSDKGARALVVSATASRLTLRAGGVNRTYDANALGIFPTLNPDLAKIIFEQHGGLDPKAFASIGFFETIRRSVADDSMPIGEERWRHLYELRNESKSVVYKQPPIDPRAQLGDVTMRRPLTSARPPLTTTRPPVVTTPPRSTSSTSPLSSNSRSTSVPDWEEDNALVCKFDLSNRTAYTSRYTQHSAEEIASAKIVRVYLGRWKGNFALPPEDATLEFGKRRRIDLESAGVPVRLDMLMNDEDGVTVETNAYFLGSPRRAEPLVIDDLKEKQRKAEATIPDRKKELASAQSKLRQYTGELQQAQRMATSNRTQLMQKQARIHSAQTLIGRTQKQLKSISNRGETTSRLVDQLKTTIPFAEGLADSGYVAVVFEFKE